mmetsp:Transcript_27687/g.41908  ORF Transcript_27687/g.41908 Transcript_27687/m.41908 type:complete len:131 (-) Transcript_27687:278-670(-)
MKMTYELKGTIFYDTVDDGKQSYFRNAGSFILPSSQKKIQTKSNPLKQSLNDNNKYLACSSRTSPKPALLSSSEYFPRFLNFTNQAAALDTVSTLTVPARGSRKRCYQLSGKFQRMHHQHTDIYLFVSTV